MNNDTTLYSNSNSSVGANDMLKAERLSLELEYREGIMWKKLGQFWLWLRAKPWRLVFLPAVAGVAVALARWAWGRCLPPDRPLPIDAMSEEDGAEIKELIHREAEAERLGFMATADALRKRIRKARRKP